MYFELTTAKNKVIIFSTKEDLKHLNSANFWVMNRTFKIVPTLFSQIYTIYAPVGSDSNSQIFPLIYCLLTSKTAVLYVKLLVF